MNTLLAVFFSCSICAQSYSIGFIEYIKGAENSVKAGFVNEKWYPHDSVEGGNKTIAYGHKIKNGEDFSEGLTEEEATELLIQDLIVAEKNAAMFLRDHYLFDWNDLEQWQREIFIDFQFNGVLRSFPKFIKFVLCKDLAGMNAQYKRYAKTANGKRIELKDRNNRFKERYLHPV